MLEHISGYGLSSKFDYYEFELDSLDNSGPTGPEATPLNWPKFEVGGTQPLQNVAALKIIQAEIPFSYYIFTPQNGTFVLEEVEGGGTVNVTITPGNYTVSELIIELDLKLAAASVNVDVYTTTFDSKTQKLTFTSDSAIGFKFTFGLSTNAGNTNPRLYIGFPGGDVSSTAAVLVAPNVIQLSGPNYLYVNSLKLGLLTNNLLPKGAKNLGGGNHGPQLCKIPVNAGPGEVIYYNDPDESYWFEVGNQPTFQELDMYLSLGNTSVPRALDLNGLSFSIKLGILVLKNTESEAYGGGFEQGRVSKRSRPL